MLVDSTTIRGWLRRCRDFPFRFRGQPASSPLAVRLGFIPTHVDDGKLLIERNIMIEDALSPAATGFPLPIERVIQFVFRSRGLRSLLNVRVKKFAEGISHSGGAARFQPGQSVAPPNFRLAVTPISAEGRNSPI